MRVRSPLAGYANKAERKRKARRMAEAYAAGQGTFLPPWAVELLLETIEEDAPPCIECQYSRAQEQRANKLVRKYADAYGHITVQMENLKKIYLGF